MFDILQMIWQMFTQDQIFMLLGLIIVVSMVGLIVSFIKLIIPVPLPDSSEKIVADLGYTMSDYFQNKDGLCDKVHEIMDQQYKIYLYKRDKKDAQIHAFQVAAVATSAAYAYRKINKLEAELNELRSKVS